MSARVVVIEDNPANLELMTYLLRAHGYVVSEATDGEAGLQLVERELPDVVVCDVQLPKIDGTEIARRMKAEESLRRIPILAVTALAMVGDRERILSAGFDGYISKPIIPGSFAGQVAAYLSEGERAAATLSKAESQYLVVHRQCNGYQVLVVDNLEVNRELARSILEPNGYAVETARGAGEGFEKARRLSPSLILSDVCMEDGTGYGLIEQLKREPSTRAIPFIFITSTMVNREDSDKGLALGADRYLFRPIAPAALLAEIEQCLLEAKR